MFAKVEICFLEKGFISKYVRGHNAKIDSAYFNSDRQTEFAKKRSQGYSLRNMLYGMLD